MDKLNIVISESRNIVSWMTSENFVRFDCAEPVVQILELLDKSGLLIIQRNSVTIVDIDGSVRCLVKSPEVGISDKLEPNYAEYVNGRLHIVYGSSYRDFGFYLDTESCSTSDVHEAK